MALTKTSSRSLVIVAKLAAVSFISLGFATTLHLLIANTLSSSSKTKTYSVVVATTAPSAPAKKTYTVVLPSLPQPVSGNRKAVQLDEAMGALSRDEAAAYRTIFAAQRAGDWELANQTAASLTDTRLLGHVLAQRFQLRGAGPQELAAWLRNYADHPEAETIYKAALKKPDRIFAKALTKPLISDGWSGGGEADTSSNFSAEIKASAPRGSSEDRLIRSINLALRQDNPTKAREILGAAQGQQSLTSMLTADAEAAVAAGFFYLGERDQALSLSTAAAGAQQPLGLWVRGLIAWEKDDNSTAAASFTRLAQHPALDSGSRAAAHFWAYRALARAGETKEARFELAQAANAKQSFYGLLAGTLLGKTSAPVIEVAFPQWGAEQRSLLLATSAGGRALALVQVGEYGLAEKELRRVNLQGQPQMQQAMLALAHYVPMPALVVQLAGLSGADSKAALSYPILPWQPANGFEVDRALLFALARHESKFDPMAVSSQGALGLMQIMPETAGLMDDDEAVESKLFDPAYNLGVGQRYVRLLANQPQIGDNLLLLLAAYNTGPTKVARWYETETMRKDGKKLDPLLFIESMPQRETRNYVMRVLPHYWAYRARLDKPVVTLKQLAEGKWPQVELSEASSVLKVASRGN
jgi:soluble lytic murein transglycosylase